MIYEISSLNCSAVVTPSAGWSELCSPEWLSKIPIVWWPGTVVRLRGPTVPGGGGGEDLYYLRNVAFPTAEHTSSFLSPSPGVPVAPGVSGFV